MLCLKADAQSWDFLNVIKDELLVFEYMSQNHHVPERCISAPIC